MRGGTLQRRTARFELLNGAIMRRLHPTDSDSVAKARKLMASRLGEGEVESVDEMKAQLEHANRYLVVFESKHCMLGAAFGFYNEENNSAQQTILTVDENHEGEGIGTALSFARIIIAADMAGTIEDLSYLTSELVPGDVEAIAAIYKNPAGRGNAFAVDFVYPLPPLSNNWTNDAEMVVLPHVMLFIPVQKDMSAETVERRAFEGVAVGNQKVLYGDEKARIIQYEIDGQLEDSKEVRLVSLNEPDERKDLGEKIEIWKGKNVWTPANIRTLLDNPLAGELIKD